MSLLILILYIVAFLLFLFAGFGVPTARFSLVAFGLASWVLAEILSHPTV